MAMLHFNEHCQAVYSKRLLMLEWNTPFINHILLPMTFGFPELKCTLKGWRFKGIKGLIKMWQQCWRLFQRGSSIKVSDSSSITAASLC